MRTYKFRGFHADEHGKTVIKLKGEEIRGFWCYGDLHTDGPYINEHKVIPETVGQYTGFLDENKNEIYDGDLLEESYWAQLNGGKIFRYKVFWEEHGYWEAERAGGRREFLPGVMSPKIIGNIFENPELLEVEK